MAPKEQKETPKRKGGARREKVPDSCMEHLHDVLADLAQSQGGFHFHGYHTAAKSQAILGGDLVHNFKFMEALAKVQPALMFRYANLKSVFTKLVAVYPAVRQVFPVNQQGSAAAKLSESTMTMCTHARRLRDEGKFKEACSALSEYQVQKLQQLRDMDDTQGNKDETPLKKKKKSETPLKDSLKKAPTKQQKKKAEPSTPPKKQKKPTRDLDAASVDTLAALELEIPCTQDSEDPEDPRKLLGSLSLGSDEEASVPSPIPARKKTIKDALKKEKGKKKEKAMKKKSKKSPMKASKSPMKASSKKPAGKAAPPLQKEYYKDDDLKLMIYHDTGRCAVRVTGGRQLFQISKFSAAVNKNQAEKLMEKLKTGTSLTEVLQLK
ncbi:unnamed protein product, partial [Symbiodinium sp. CCMP2456]